MEKASLITVIVPVYKVEDYLDRCVKSIVRQTYENLEIILVDDGSTDRCPEMCDAWAHKDKRIRVIHKENGGLSEARNVGMKNANGDFIGFVDSDDWIAPEMYERLVTALQRDGSDIAACSVQIVWEDGRPGGLLTIQKSCILDRNEAQMALLKESLLKQPVWYKLYRSSKIKLIPFEKGKYHEDVFWSYQAVGNAEKVSLIDYIGYFYCQRAASIMGETYSLKRLDAVEAKVRRQGYLEKHFPQLVSCGRIELHRTCLYHGQNIVLHLKGEKRRCALSYLKTICRQNKLTKNDLTDVKLTHLFWFLLEKISFEFCCFVRNVCRIGL